MMQAQLLTLPQPIGERPLVNRDLPLPTPGPGQIRLQVSVCGLCHTDLHTVEGDLDLPRTPLIPGHQIVGIVDQLGKNVADFQLGDRVGVGWLGWVCGKCRYCRAGQENLCPAAQFTGLHIDGGYASYAVADAGFAYQLPDSFTDFDAAPLLCAGIIGYRSILLSDIQPGGCLGLYGFGASAHLVIQVARFWDCKVYVFTRSKDHRRHALGLGAAWAGGAEEEPPTLLDAAVTFAPAGWIVPRALAHLRPGGTVAINAVHMSTIPAMSYDIIYGEKVVRSVANYTRQDAYAFLNLAAQIPIKTTVTVFPLSQANEALERLKASTINGAAVLQVADRVSGPTTNS